MPKLSPHERWERHIIERVKALKLSKELKPLRKRGLAVLKRKRLYTPEEWYRGFWERGASPQYLQWYEECKALADRFGLAPWVVAMLCLFKGYKPEKDLGLIVMEAVWPKIRVVTESADWHFLRSLAREAQRLGLFVVQRQGSFESTVIDSDYSQTEVEPLPLSSKPPAYVAFRMRVEVPPDYPPEAASQLQKEASRLGRQLRRRLDYPTRERLRTSPLVSMVEELKMDTRPLPRRESYEIIDAVYKDEDSARDQERQRLIKSRRRKLKKRLVEPYQNDTASSR